MGIFDFLSPNTTGATDAATAGAQASLGATQDQNNRILRNTTGQANDALKTAATNATGDLNTGYSNASGALTSYLGKAQGALSSGVNSAVGTIEGSNANYQPYATSGGTASGALSDALGINGAAGNTRATAAFQAAPGYQYSVDQATDAASRAAAATGMGASGNTLKAVATLGQNLANQGYQQYVSNLSGLAGQGLTAASGISGNNTAAGSAQLTGGTQGASLDQSTGTALGNLNIGQGQSLAGVQTGLGSALSGNLTNLGTNIVANNTGLTEAAAGASLADASAQDQAASANNGLFTKALGSLFSPVASKVGGQIAGYL